MPVSRELDNPQLESSFKEMPDTQIGVHLGEVFNEIAIDALLLRGFMRKYKIPYDYLELHIGIENDNALSYWGLHSKRSTPAEQSSVYIFPENIINFLHTSYRGLGKSLFIWNLEYYSSKTLVHELLHHKACRLRENYDLEKAKGDVDESKYAELIPFGLTKNSCATPEEQSGSQEEVEVRAQTEEIFEWSDWLGHLVVCDVK